MVELFYGAALLKNFICPKKPDKAAAEIASVKKLRKEVLLILSVKINCFKLPHILPLPCIFIYQSLSGELGEAAFTL